MMKKNFYKIVLLSFLFGLVALFLKGYLYKKEIKENKGETICKYVFCKKFPKTTESFFKYYINGKQYQSSYGKCPNDYQKKIDKFFVLYYSTKNVEKIEVDFSIPITDTVSILKAGFSNKDF